MFLCCCHPSFCRVDFLFRTSIFLLPLLPAAAVVCRFFALGVVVLFSPLLVVPSFRSSFFCLAVSECTRSKSNYKCRAYIFTFPHSTSLYAVRFFLVCSNVEPVSFDDQNSRNRETTLRPCVSFILAVLHQHPAMHQNPCPGCRRATEKHRWTLASTRYPSPNNLRGNALPGTTFGARVYQNMP